MRADTIQFAQANEAPSKRPRYVVSMLFETASLYFTSHDDISSVPGVVLESVLKDPSAISQRLVPDEGRSEIGSFSFTLVDLASAVTDALRDKLLDGAGMRGRTVQFWCGFEGFDFTAFSLFQTQVVVDASYEGGVYTVNCADITRVQRQDLFEPKFTTLRDSVSATATTIPVYVTDGFERIVHGTSWSDAPSSTVGYIKLEDEVIRYTGKTADSFTGCTRGVLNTRAAEHAVDAGTVAERRTKVEEYIYIELPAVKLAWALNTGVLYGSANTLPDHWHLGIAPSFLRESDFTGIGTDLWNPSDDAAALILRFEGVKKQDGKRFLETQVYLVLGCYSPVYSDGKLGLRRHHALISDSSPVFTLTEREIVQLGPLQHDLSGMHNNIRVNWNYDNAKEQFTRITSFLDEESIEINGTADVVEYSFKGLYGSRHTDAIVVERLGALRDAYAYPPQRISVTVFGSLSRGELGDVARLRVANVRDFAGNPGSIDRSFVILNKSHDASRNEVIFDLFGSTARPLAKPTGTSSTAPLPDAFYTSAGTNLNTIATITGNTMATGNYTLTGNVDLNNAGAVFYWNSDLTIPNGCNLTIARNVQLRIRGFLTLNGTINGVGGGLAGVADDGSSPWDKQIPGNPGYIGTVRGWDGINVTGFSPVGGLVAGTTLPAPITQGKYAASPFLSLVVSGSTLSGLPSDLRGSGGGPGGRIINFSTSVIGEGGAGADGGAGLAIICRGMGLGVSASITLNGDDTTNPGLESFSTATMYPGAGAPGGPGAMLILLDGNSLSIPDITGKFVATTGVVAQAGNPMTERTQQLFAESLSRPELSNPHSGYRDPGLTTALDFSNAAHRIQYIPESQSPAIDAPIRPPAPTAINIQPRGEFNTVGVSAVLSIGDEIELYASIDNNRANSVLVDHGKTFVFTHELPALATRYYWARVRRNYEDRPDQVSDWYPTGSTSGVSGTTLNPNGWTPVTSGASGSTMLVSANQIQKSGGTTAWDSQVYSRESYASGCSVSFRPLQNNAQFMVGLNADPATDASYASIDYAWYCSNGGSVEIYEGGVAKGVIGSYDTSTTFEIRYDGVWVRYLRNGVVVREVYDVGQRFFLDSSWNTPGAAAASIQFVSLTSTSPVAFIARGNCRVSNTSVIKQGGATAWDSDCYSIVGYPICHVSFKPNDTSTQFMVGMNSDPTVDQSYASLDGAWYCNAGAAQIYENGALIGSYGSYSMSTLFAITYDGTNVRYYKDDLTTPVRTAGPVSGNLFMDSSFYTAGAGINSVRFGPTTNLEVTDTSQIGSNAVTDVISTVFGPVDVYTSGTSSIAVILSTPAYSFDTIQVVTGTGFVDLHAPSAQFPAFLLITDELGGYTYGDNIGLTERTIARNPSTALPDDRNSFTREVRFNVPAGTAKTFYMAMQAGGIFSSGAFCNINNGVFKIEVIKK